VLLKFIGIRKKTAIALSCSIRGIWSTNCGFNYYNVLVSM